MKVAKLEVKMILALMLARYDYTLVDSAGKPCEHVPKPNRNDVHQVCLPHYLYIFLITYLCYVFRLDHWENLVSSSTRS